MNKQEKKDFLAKYYGEKMRFKDGGDEVWAEHVLHGINIRGNFLDGATDPWDFCEPISERKTRNMTGQELMGKIIKSPEGAIALITRIHKDGEIWEWDELTEKDRWMSVEKLIEQGWTLEDGSPLTVEVEND